jgi:hypothetical protein
MSAAERRLRSELTRLLHSHGVIRGSVAIRERTCGKASCRCVTRGEKHVSMYLVVCEGGKYRQVFVPKALHEPVHAWVRNHKKARELLEEISVLHYEKLRKREL